jgi:hypothetical protein
MAYFRDAAYGRVVSGEHERDNLILRWLEDVEAGAKRDLASLKEKEKTLRISREAAAKRALAQADEVNPNVLFEPEAISLDKLAKATRAEIEVRLAAAPHDDVVRSVADQLDVIERIQHDRAHIENAKTQRSSVALQRWIAFGTIGSMIVAAIAAVIAVLALVVKFK